MTDDELMYAIAQQDQQAFAELVQRHLDALYAYAVRLTRSTELAEDLLQDTWLAVWEKAGRYKPGKVKLTTWLHKVLHNRGVDLLRRKAPDYDTEWVEQQIDPASSEVADETTMVRQQRWAAYHLALSQLPYEQRAALLLSHVHGFANSEVAQIMGCSVRAVESRQARARSMLKKLLATDASTAN